MGQLTCSPSEKVQLAIDEEAKRLCTDGMVKKEHRLDSMLMKALTQKSQENDTGCIVLQITAFEAPTRFQRLPLWSLLKSKKVQWVDVVLDAVVTAPSAGSALPDAGYK